ncbi:MAG: hypothetical protein QGG36_27710 [Pirellulaceae bacterium]|jgi:hypothetical protein|nr:hypothetical protein [Pirellulaceae bacterium]
MTSVGEYLSRNARSFWRWEEDGEVIVWRNGETLCFREELHAACARLAPRGLPPLPSILLLMGAIRDNYAEVRHEARPKCVNTAESQQVCELPFIEQVYDNLDRLHGFSRSLRTARNSANELAAMVFEIRGFPPKISPREADDVVAVLAGGVPPAIWSRTTTSLQAEPLSDLIDALRWLEPGLDRLDEERWRLRLETGVEQLPQGAEIDDDLLSFSEQTRRLLTELQEDETWRGVGQLAQQMMAAVALPRPLLDPEDLSTGGVADIANRGSLDRLLLSELANDDLTLATRIALSEALYLKRESPPKQPPQGRTIVLDGGIRMWGVPRLFSVAAGLAFAATAEKQVDVNVFRPEETDLIRVALNSRDGLSEHLGVVRPDPHPGASLAAFAETIDDGSAIFVTHERVLQDSGFRRALDQAALPEFFLATVNERGDFKIRQYSERGVRLLREAQFDLDQIAPREPDQPPLREAMGLPAICRVNPFPLWLYDQISGISQGWSVDDNSAFPVTKDGRLLHWCGGEYGGRQVAIGIPPGSVAWADTSSARAEPIALLVDEDSRRCHLLKINEQKTVCQTTSLSVDSRIQGAAAHNGAIMVVCEEEILAFDEHGSEIARLPRQPNVNYYRDRFFRSHVAWHALGFDGIDLRLEPIRDAAFCGIHPVAVFDSSRGPIGVSPQGALLPTDGSAAIPLKPAIGGKISAVYSGRDGKLVRISTFQGLSVLVDTELGTCMYRNRRKLPLALDARLDALVNPRSLRRRLISAFLDDEGQLHLRTKKIILKLAYETGGSNFYLRPSRATPPRAGGFKPIQTPAEAGVQLSAVAWPDGSRVVLDRRGLLHLQSSDLEIPEITLVLASEGGLPGWCSNGDTFGPAYYTGREGARSPGEQTREAFTEFLECAASS